MNPSGTPEPNIDPQILANAIRLNEGGDNYSAKGDSGTSWGAYQFGKGAWEKAAKLAGVASKWGEADPADQNAAADAQIKQWLSEGKTVPQIPAMWNAGAGEPDAYTGKFSTGNPSVGYNASIKSNFDVPGYVKNVLNTAARLYDQKNSQPQSARPEATAQPEQDSGLTVTGGPQQQSGGSLGALLGVGLGGALAAGKMALSGPALPIAGGAIGEVLGGPLGATAGGLLGEGARNALHSGDENQTPPQHTQMYSALQDALSQTIGGNAAMQEGERRGVDPIEAMVSSGAVPQPDENGNLDKVNAVSILQDQIKQDKKFQAHSLAGMTEGISLHDVEKSALAEAAAKMEGSPNLAATQDKIRKTFANYREQQPKATDKHRKQYIKSFHVTPERLQLMKDRATEGVDWSVPHHEREAAQHIYHAMKKHLSEVAKKHHVHGWDETNKRMEARLLAIKAIKKMPKKAARDKRGELVRSLLAAAGGAAIGKTFGHGLVGGTMGYLLRERLGHKQYKKVGSKEERHEAHKRAHEPQKSLISHDEKHKAKEHSQ